MNLIELTTFTGDINDAEDKSYECHINYEIIDFITDTENGTLVYLNRDVTNEQAPHMNGVIRVMETAEEIRDIIDKMELHKSMDKINYPPYPADAISKDWVEPIDYGKETQV